MKKIKIGVFGSAVSKGNVAVDKAKEIGIELAKHKDVIIITGGNTGIPYVAAYEAKQNGAEIWAYPSVINNEDLKKSCLEDDISIYDKLFYVPKDYEFAKDPGVCKKYRNVTSTANCDGAIVLSGRWGTINEFANLYDMGKVIGVLTDTGGISDELPHLFKIISKPTKAKVIFNSSPKDLIEEVIKTIWVSKKG